MPDYVRLSVNMNKDTLAELKRLAAIRRSTVTAVLHQAVASEIFFEEERSKGSKVLLESRDGRLSIVSASTVEFHNG